MFGKWACASKCYLVKDGGGGRFGWSSPPLPGSGAARDCSDADGGGEGLGGQNKRRCLYSLRASLNTPR